MSLDQPTFLEATISLDDAVRGETMLARTGALVRLKQAAAAKQAAFDRFREICGARDPQLPLSHAERNALRALLTSANESALVLEAVRGVLDNFVDGLKAAVSALADAGTYGPSGWRVRDVRAVRIDASA